MRNINLLIAAVGFALVSLLYPQWPPSVTESYGDQLIMGMVRNRPLKLVPYQVYSTDQKQLIHFVFGTGLLQKPGKMASPPPLIDRYVRDAGQSDRVWRIVLRRNVIFQDGTDLRNQDVKFTFEFLKRFGGYVLNRRLNFQSIQQIDLDGDLEVRFVLDRPNPRFFEEFNDVAILSSRYYREAMTRGMEVFEEKTPMGLGPFAVESISPERIQLKFHRHYFAGRPFINNIQVRLYDSEQAMVDALVNGELDYLELQDRRLAEQLHQLMGKKILVFTIPRPEKKLFFILLNLRGFPFQQRGVREAIQLAINREGLVERFKGTGQKLANTLFAEGDPVYYRPLFRGSYNPSRALDLLTQAGWHIDSQKGVLVKNGRPFSFKLYFSQFSTLEESIARLVKIYLGELNINVQPVPIPEGEKLDHVQNNDFQAMILTYSYDPNYPLEAAEQFYFDVLKGDLSNPNYTNSRLDRLFNAVYQRPELREELFHRFQFYIKRDRPAIFLFFDQRIIVVLSSRFHNVRSVFKQDGHFFYRLNPIENWYVPKELQKYNF
ncbi:MAG: ABC transporter substrate-binding protein [Calditrichaeota bacterium]|nr:MAG: ABC transporter substrate-binding protein [Calditrichota bacterium]